MGKSFKENPYPPNLPSLVWSSFLSQSGNPHPSRGLPITGLDVNQPPSLSLDRLIVSLSEGWCPHNYWLLSNGVLLEDMELYVAPIDSGGAMGQVPYKGHHVHQLCDFLVLFF